MLGHRNFEGDRRVIGRSMIVGRIIFSIVRGLDFGDGLSRGYGRRQLRWRGQCLPHRQRRLVLGWVLGMKMLFGFELVMWIGLYIWIVLCSLDIVRLRLSGFGGRLILGCLG